MCGIIGYTGAGNAVPKITEGLSVLEYRGYDSVGLAAEVGNTITVCKCRGRISSLEERLSVTPIPEAHCAIGHTRWATHGGPSDHNAHPHRVGDVVLVHNGIIENYRELKQKLGEEISYQSETDTEVAAAWIHSFYRVSHDPVRAIREATAQMRGSFAFGILFADRPGQVYAIRLGSPLLLGHGKDGFYLASDLPALLPFTAEYYCPEEGELAVLTPEYAALLGENGERTEPAWRTTNLSPEAARKDGYPHFMLKEIHEQPDAVRKSLFPRLRDGMPDFSCDGIEEDFWREITGVQIVACGSAMHAGLLGRRLLERYASLPCTVHIASEYRYHPPLAQKGTLVVLISQSGETADTLACLRYAKEAGLPTLAIVNAVESSIAREADRRIYTYAGPEIAVATTKGYCTQLSVLYLIAAAAAYARGNITEKDARALAYTLTEEVPEAIRDIISRREQLAQIATTLAKKDHIFYIGRGADADLSEEGALKLKEISYIHAEAYAAGELKHGTISLVEENTPVVAISTDAALYDKTESNVREVRSRGAYVILLCRTDAENPQSSADCVIRLPSASEATTLFSALTTVQLLAYETAAQRGCDIDRPRNLAKSVTVE